MDSTSENESKRVPAVKLKTPAAKKRRKQKPKDFPKRPLSAYNIFFKETREELLAKRDDGEGGGTDAVDFQSMVKEIAARWKTLEDGPRKRVEQLASKDLLRYRDEVRAYEDEMVRKSRLEREEMAKKKKKEDEKMAAQEAAASAHREREELHTAEMGNTPYAPRTISTIASRSATEHQMILEQELRNLDAARELKIRQLQLAQLQHHNSSAGPESLLRPSPESPGILSQYHLPSYPSAASYAVSSAELEILRARHAAGLGFPLSGTPIGLVAAGGLGGLPLHHYASTAYLPTGLQFAYPNVGVAAGQDPYLRSYAIQEHDLLSTSRLGAGGGGPSASSLASHRRPADPQPASALSTAEAGPLRHAHYAMPNGAGEYVASDPRSEGAPGVVKRAGIGPPAAIPTPSITRNNEQHSSMKHPVEVDSSDDD